MKNARTIVRLAGIGFAASVTLGVLAAGSANADTFVPLPSGDITHVLEDGTHVHLSRSGESANITPSMGATPLHRNVWTSGHGEVNLSGGGANSSDTYTQLEPGYVVGCQVDLQGIEPGVDGNVSASMSGNSASVSGGGGGSLSLTLAGGQAKSFYILDLEHADDYGGEKHESHNETSGTHSSVTWKDESFSVDGCAGYAQARSFIRVMVHTPTTVGYTTLWGKPFSIG